MPDIIMPHSKGSEDALIGAVLIDNEQLSRLAVQPEDFYIERNRWVWAAILDMRRAGKQIDTVTLAVTLNARDQLGQIGGQPELMRYSAACDTSIDAPSYAAEVKDCARRRYCLQAAQKLARAMIDRTTDITGEIAAHIEDISRAAQNITGAEHIKRYLGIAWDELVAAMEKPKDVYGIETGLTGFDRITWGLQPGETMLLSGDPGVGKSLLAMQLACGMGKHTPGAVFELEMTGLAVVRRRLSAISQVPTYKFRQGHITDDEYQSIVAAIAEMEKLNIWLSDASSWTTMEMRVELQRLKSQYGVKWFMVDYQGLLKDNAGANWIERERIVSARLHDIAKDLQIAGLIIDTQNKAGIANKDAGQARLSGAAGKLYDADQIAFLECREPVSRMYRLKWEKLREGADARRALDLQLTTGFPAFREIVRQERGYKTPYKEE